MTRQRIARPRQYRNLPKAAFTGVAAALLLGLAAPNAAAEPTPGGASPAAPSATDRAAAHRAAQAPGTLDTLSRFFARDSGVTRSDTEPRIKGEAVPVYYLSPEFVAGKRGAPVARLQFLASEAVSADGREASLWTVKRNGAWQVVNIATGDDETHYARVGTEKLPGGTVFHEPQIDAWYVQRDARVLPLDRDAADAIGSAGTSLAAYQKRVEKEYGDKLPGSAYDRSGKAGGFGPEAKDAAPDAHGAAPDTHGSAPDTAPAAKGTAPQAAERAAPAPAATDAGPAVTVAATAAGAGALVALGLSVARMVRQRRD